MPSKVQQSGFNLIELMIAMALGLIVSLGITQVFISAKNTYVTQNAAAAIQEDSRFVLSKMLQEIRMVGMFGCKQSVTPPGTNPEAFKSAFEKPIEFTSDPADGNVLTLITSDVGINGGVPTWSIAYDCWNPSVAYLNSNVAEVDKDKQVLPIRQVVYTYLKNQLLMTTGGSKLVLIDNVTKFEVSFGVANNVDEKTVRKYVSVVTDPGFIRSVRITMTVADATGRASPQTFNVVAALRNRVN
jgi:type IV pilus assembly protein PilW